MNATTRPDIIAGLNELFSWPREKIARDVHPDFIRYFSEYLERGNIDSYHRQIAAYVAESGFHGSVLDFGCGFGLAGLCMRSLGVNDVTGADLVPGKYETAQKIADYVGCDRIRFVQSDDNLAFEDASFDGLFIKDALSHFYEDSPFLAHAYRVLKPGGILMIVDDRNSLSPLSVRNTHQIWEVSESGSPEQTKKLGIPRNYTVQRFEFLQTHFAEIDPARLQEIAEKYRGYTNEEIGNWLKGGALGEKRAPCVGPSGIVQERLINPLVLKRQLQQLGFECRLRPGYRSKAWKHAVGHIMWPASLLFSGLFHAIARKP
jgi:ubiquinone/menaquinone biosynthesis C-methylase UbiE